MRYSIIHHDVREQFKLTVSQYLVADSIHQLSRKGVCEHTDTELGLFLGLSRQHVNESKAVLLKKGLIEKVGSAFTTTSIWHNSVTHKSVVKSDNRAKVSENPTNLSENPTPYIIYKDIKKGVSKETQFSPPSFKVVKDTQTSKVPKDKEAWGLREKLYGMFEKEYGVRPTPNMGDYQRVIAARKRMAVNEIVDLVEDALEEGKKRTVREMLTDRAIDIYVQNS